MSVEAGVNITGSVQRALDNVFGFLPNLLGFLVILAIGYIIAKIVKAVVNKALQRLRLDEHLTSSHAGNFVEKVSPGGRPSRLVGGVVFWLIFLYALSAAIGALKIPAVTSFMDQVLAYLPNVIAAVIIFVVASVIATAVVALVERTMGDTPTGKIVETVVPGLVMAVAVFMILTQLKIATAIVTITYAAVVGMLALAGALAFGLGGRDVAARLLETAYQNGQDAKEQAKRDAQSAKERAQDQLDDAYPEETTTASSRNGSSRSRSPRSARKTTASRRR